jgi:uncharacterized protein YbbK (DUF523 family)
MYIVSACLAGIASRYDGTGLGDEAIMRLVASGDAIPICPEQLGGLPTPRIKISFRNGDGHAIASGFKDVHAIGFDGIDYTDNLIRGAMEVLKIARLTNPKAVIFKDGSPSCGVNRVWIKNERVKGCGVTTAFLKREGINVMSLEEWKDINI